MSTASSAAPDRGGRRHPVLRLTAAATALVVVLGLTACGADDDDDGATATTLALTEVEPDQDPSTAPEGEPDDPGTTVDPGTDPVPVEPGPLPELSDFEQEYADAVTVSFATDGEDFFPGADIECMSVRWVAAIGGDALEASGLDPEEFAYDGPAEIGIDRATAEKMVAIMEMCGADLEAFYEGFALGYTGTEGELLAETQQELLDCMKAAVPVSMLREALVTSFMGDDDAGMDAIGDEWLNCAPGEG